MDMIHHALSPESLEQAKRTEDFLRDKLAEMAPPSGELAAALDAQLRKRADQIAEAADQAAHAKRQRQEA